MMEHLDGPTLIVTKLPDGRLAWTVIQPQAMEISFDGWSPRIGFKLKGWVMTGDWCYGPPPADWERTATEQIGTPYPALGPREIHRLGSGPARKESA